MSRARGRHWEETAERWLNDKGARLIARNFHCRIGEIDLIVRDGSEIAFIEVKFRSRAGYGTGADHVTFTKQRRIIGAARHYLQYHDHPPTQVFRFDVISIAATVGGTEIEWIKNAFEAV